MKDLQLFLRQTGGGAGIIPGYQATRAEIDRALAGLKPGEYETGLRGIYEKYAPGSTSVNPFFAQGAGQPSSSMSFDPLGFLSALEQGQSMRIQAPTVGGGAGSSMTFIPYKPSDSSRFMAQGSGYTEVAPGTGVFARTSDAGDEIYVPQDRTAELGKALSGSSGLGSTVATGLAVPSGQEGLPVAPDSGDVSPEPVAAGTDTGTTVSPAVGSNATPTPTTQGPIAGSMKAGGMVPKTGTYRLHEGEAVVPADEVDQYLKDIDSGKTKPGTLRDVIREQRNRMGPGKRSDAGGPMVAHHEQSETTKDSRSGKWKNVYGKETSVPGRKIPGTSDHDSMESAVDEAKDRSRNTPADAEDPLRIQRQHERSAGDEPVSERPADRWYVHMKEGIPTQDIEDPTHPSVRRLAFTKEDVQDALDAGESPIMVGRGILKAPPSLMMNVLQKANMSQMKNPDRHPGMVATKARAKMLAQAQPRFPGDRGPGADVPLDSVGRHDVTRDRLPFLDVQPGDPPPGGGKREMMDMPGFPVPGTQDPMPMIPNNPQPMPMRTFNNTGFGRALAQAQPPQGSMGSLDQMLQGIDKGTIAPSTLGGAIRTQQPLRTPPPQPTKPSLFEGVKGLRRQLLG
jgi:hypothetical protein